jgi:hypothetical protein
LKPQAEHIALAVHPDRQRQVARPALDAAAIADLEHQRVQEDDRIDLIQRAALPSAGIVHDRVGHLRDQVAADLDAVDLSQVRLDVPGREPPAVEREDLLVEALEPPLTLAHDLRLARARPIPRRVDPDRAVLGDQRLRRAAIARVAGPARRLLMQLIAAVIGQLDLHRPLHQPLGQLREQPARPGDLLLGTRTDEQLVEPLVRQ